MATARSRLVDVSVTRWYHCISRCVRQAFLLGEGASNRREWIFREGKVMISAELAGIFERLGCTTDQWADRLTQLRRGRLPGRIFAAGRARLEELAKKLKVRHLVNLRGGLALSGDMELDAADWLNISILYMGTRVRKRQGQARRPPTGRFYREQQP